MANYSLVIDSKFRPFEYQELLAPVLMATQAHQALEEAYGDLDTEAAVWDRRTEGSERAHSLYTNFSRDLDSAAETLSKYGLTPQSRRTMLNMKSRYAKDITPIVEAWTKRQADIKAQQEAMLRDPYHAFNRVAADTSLDTYLDNPNIDVLSENASGAALAAQVRAMAGDIKNYIDNRNIGKLEKLGLPYQYIQKIIHGATADQVLKTMQGDPEAAPFLYNIVDTVMKGSGVRDWSSMNGDWRNNSLYKQLESQAMTGLTAAIGTTELKNYTDNFSMQSALMRAKAKADAEAEKKSILPYRRIANSKVLEADTTSLNNDLKFLQKLSKTGVKNLSKKAPDRPITSYRAAIGAPSDSSDYDRVMANYRRIAKEYGLGNVKAWGPNNNATLINKIQNRIRQNIQRAQTYQLNMTDQSQVAQILQENSNTFSIKDRNRSGFNEIDGKGRVAKPIDAEDAAKIFEEGKDFNLSYDPSIGFQLSYRKGSEFVTVNIEPELLNFGDADYTLGHKYVNQYINSGREDYANDLIDEMMTGLYYRFNTQAKKQSATDSNIR